MFKIKRFQSRILLALMGVGLIPAALLLLAGTLVLREGVSSFGTAGPWASVAESGQVLLDAVAEGEVSDSTVDRAVQEHRAALSDGLRNSRILEVILDRILALLPFVALVLALFIGGLSFWAARQLSGGFSRPIGDLVGWTELIAKGHPLPAPGPKDARGVQEFALLRNALRSMAEDLEEGKRQTIQAEKLRSWTEMTRRLAHELKNPLSPMRMAATAINRLEEEGAQEAGAVLLEEITRLDELARTFSQFGTMPEGPPSQVDMAELLELLIGQHQEEGPRLRLQASPDLPLVTAHYDALLRCFRNLLLNATEAAGKEGEVHVRAWAEKESGPGSAFLKVEIQDSGPGISEDHLEQIWEPDFTTKSRGTGLGLAMVRQTIHAYQGRVEGRNNPEGGAVFLVEIPVPESE